MRTAAKFAGRALALFAALTVLPPLASAYYYWVFFSGSAAPFVPFAARFDFAAIKDNTVQYFISDQPPGPLAPGDGLPSIDSEIRQAAQVWNSVSSSALRLHFGGVRNMAVPQSVPGIDVVFDDDMPPGIIAQTKLTFPADLSFLDAKGTTFVPILRSKLQLRKDLTAAGYQQSSYSDAFFTTLVHEFGHSIGLQHTFTSAVMSTAITRAATRGMPLGADDVAGVSLLYPTGLYPTGLNTPGGYLATTGSITGTVTAAGVGVNLASVVAISTNGVAISGVTTPDGAYRIDGIPPGNYYVYVHPLPPPQTGEATPANITIPQDPQGDAFPANTQFVTEFFPGTQDWTQAAVVTVVASKAASKIDFAVTPSAGPAVYAMQTYGYPAGVAIPAPPFPAKSRNALVFYANGATINNQSAMAPGLAVSVIGSAATVEPGSLKYYQQGFLLAVVDTADPPGDTPVALSVRLNGDLYVLPAAFTVVPGPAPSVTSATSQPVSALQVVTFVSGSNLTASTRVLFDGAPARVLWVNKDNSLAVAEPPGLSGMQAVVEAVNPDGQSSLQSLGSASPPVYTYPQLNAPGLQPTPGAVIAGTDTFLVINAVNTHFSQGATDVGFGSSDISVRGLWVLNPQWLIMSLSIDPGAQPGPVSITAATGLEIVTQSNALTIVAAAPNQASLRVPIVNAVTGLAGIPVGGTALIQTSGLPPNLDGWSLTIGSRPAAFTADKGVLTVQIPAGLGLGPLLTQLTAPGNNVAVPTVVTQIDPAPPILITAVDTPPPPSDPKAPALPSFSVNSSTPAQLGDTVTLTALGLSASTGVLPPASAVWVNLAGTVYPVVSVVAIPGDPQANAPPPDLAHVSFTVPPGLVVDPTESHPTIPLMVGTGTRLSAAYILDVAAQPAPPSK